VPHRTVNIVLAALGLAGLVVIAVLAIWGADIRRAARSGPKWKRKTVAAGLLLLALMGFGGCGGVADEEPEPQAAAVRDADKRKKAIAEAWRGLDAAWEHGADYAFGRHGPRPFDKATKDAVLKQTEQFDLHAATLERLGEIKNIEADALRLEWDFIQERIELLPAADLRIGVPRYDLNCQLYAEDAKALLPHMNALIEADEVNQQVAQIMLLYAAGPVSALADDPEDVSYAVHAEGRVVHDKLLAAYLKLESRTVIQAARLNSHEAWKTAMGIIRDEVLWSPNDYSCYQLLDPDETQEPEKQDEPEEPAGLFDPSGTEGSDKSGDAVEGEFFLKIDGEFVQVEWDEAFKSEFYVKIDGKFVRAKLADGAGLFDPDGPGVDVPEEDGDNALEGLFKPASKYPKYIKKMEQAGKELDELRRKGAICDAELKALQKVLQMATFSEKEYVDKHSRSFDLDYDLRMAKRDPWVIVLGKLAAQKSIPRCLQARILAAAKSKINLESGKSDSFRTVYPYKSGLSMRSNTDIADMMSKSLRSIRTLPLSESGELLKSEHWARITGAYRQIDEIAKRKWDITYHDIRRVRKLIESLGQSISSLAGQGLLSEAEAGILSAERQAMLRVVRYQQDYSCGILEQGAACNRMSRRLESLSRLALLDRLDWRVADYVLPGVEGDLGVLDLLEGDRASVFIVGQADSGNDGSDPDRASGGEEPEVWVDDRGRPKKVIDKMLAVRAGGRAELKKIRDKSTVNEKSLAQTPQWRALSEVWREAQSATSWDSYMRTSTNFGEHRLIGRLENTLWDIEALRRAELLSEAEAGLLRADVELFIEGVAVNETWENGVSTCYDAGYPTFPIYPEQWTNLDKRIPLLTKLADSPKLRPEVVAKILYVVQKDVSISDASRYNTIVDKAKQAEIKRMVKAAQALINKMRKRMRADDVTLAQNAEWRSIKQACSLAANAVETGTDFRKRKEIQDALDQASVDVYLLFAQGLLDGREAVLVNTLITNARQRLTYNPPTDFTSDAYESPVKSLEPQHVWPMVLMRRNVRDTPQGESFGREILLLLQQSLETDIKLLESNHHATYCDGCNWTTFKKESKALRDRLARVKKKLIEEK
jgi:hypothetical protein